MEEARHYIPVGKTSEVKPGQLKAVRANGHSLVLANQGGTFFATQDLCTHDNGPLADGELIDDEIECPRHGARFDIHTGRVMALPAMRPIRVFPVKVEGDQILVAID